MEMVIGHMEIVPSEEGKDMACVASLKRLALIEKRLNVLNLRSRL